MYVDMHTHLRGWSPDAQQSIEELLDAAEQKRLDGVAVTDHYDIDSVTASGQRWIFDPKAYCREISRYRRYPSQRRENQRPGALTGIEISFLPNHTGELHRLIADNPFDCVILSLHEYRKIDPVTAPGDLYDGDLSVVYDRLIGAIAETAETFPEANVIGHYDFFSRYAPVERPKMLYHHAPAAFDRLFSALIRNGQALEINTGTVEALHKKRGYALYDAMPDAELLLRYRALGGTLLTLGSDAHCTEDVARYFKETAAWLRLQGFPSYSWIEKQRWHSAPLL